MKPAIAILGSIGIALANASIAAQSTDAFAGIPDVAIAHYDVEGADAAAIRRSINAHRLVDPNDGSRVDSLSNWHYGWHWSRRNTAAGCQVTGVTVDFTAVVRLPRLVGDVSPAVRAQWDRYIAALERHEAGHVRYAYDHRGDVATAIGAANCDATAAAGKAAIALIDVYEVTYDRTTRHGQTQGATLP